MVQDVLFNFIEIEIIALKDAIPLVRGVDRRSMT